MLTIEQTRQTSKELKENYKRLINNMSKEKMLEELDMSEEDFDNALEVSNTYPGNVWEVRDYFEYKLQDNMYPFSVLYDDRANKWFSYDRPWLENS